MPPPIIGITMGDPAGIGPEIIVKALAAREVYDMCRPLVIGDTRRLRTAANLASASVKVAALREPEDAAFRLGTIDCLDLAVVPEDLPFGRLSGVAGDAAYRFIERAVALA